jgi:hypothetical protein
MTGSDSIHARDLHFHLCFSLMVIIGPKSVQYIQGRSVTTYDGIQRDWDTTDALSWQHVNV